MMQVIRTISLILWQKLLPFFHFLCAFFRDLVFGLIVVTVLTILMYGCCIKAG